ncbi:hypothetical protein MNBD_ALPHA11-1551 [hydrothermal vent metagenome]|uniref:Cyclic nucleotide-binding domain-containing protein n=1 Tax=hydrothermal vent metagenome TaxID=652676 RepID=A0A3B0U0G1_9ZZZZ
MIAIMQHDFFDYLANLPSRKYRFSSGQRVFDFEGEVKYFRVVRRGLVHLQRVQKDGTAVVLQRASDGMILAEASVFSDIYHCSALAINDSMLQVYPMKEIQNLLGKNPAVALAFSAHLAEQVRLARKRAEILTLKTVAERLSAWLIWNSGELPSKGGWHHVADEIGTSREALYRELSKRRKQRNG